MSDTYWDKAIHGDGSTRAAFTIETYGYDALNRLSTQRRDGHLLDARYYDGADRVVFSGIDSGLSKTFFDRSGLKGEQRRNTYDSAGRLSHTQVVGMTARGLSTRYETTYSGYDEAGNVTQYREDKLLLAVSSKRSLVIAKPGSEELRMLDYFGAEASVGGVNNSSILLRENPSKAAVIEEFLHGTQARLGIVDHLGTSGLGSAETHVKDFMIRHRNMLNLNSEDVRIIKILRDKGL